MNARVLAAPASGRIITSFTAETLGDVSDKNREGFNRISVVCFEFKSNGPANSGTH